MVLASITSSLKLFQPSTNLFARENTFIYEQIRLLWFLCVLLYIFLPHLCFLSLTLWPNIPGFAGLTDFSCVRLLLWGYTCTVLNIVTKDAVQYIILYIIHYILVQYIIHKWMYKQRHLNCITRQALHNLFLQIHERQMFKFQAAVTHAHIYSLHSINNTYESNIDYCFTCYVYFSK